MLKGGWCSFLLVVLFLLFFSSVMSCRPLSVATDNTSPVTVNSTSPVIEAVGVSDITESSARIRWRTDDEATSQVEYGETPGYGSKKPTDEDLGKEISTDHIIILEGLAENTTVHFRVKSKDASGNEGTSGDNTFTTLRIKTGCDIGNRAPDFTLKDVDGKDVTLSSFRGKVVVINFWYTTCAPCAKELQYLQNVFSSDSSAQNSVLLAVHHKGRAEDVQQWLASRQYSLPVAMDAEGKVAEKYCVRTYPTTYFVGADGIIKKVKPGPFKSEKEIEDILDSLKQGETSERS